MLRPFLRSLLLNFSALILLILSDSWSLRSLKSFHFTIVLVSLREVKSSIISLRRTHIIIAKELSKRVKIWLPHCVFELHVTHIADLFIIPKPVADGRSQLLIEGSVRELHIVVICVLHMQVFFFQRNFHLCSSLVETG